MREPQVSYESLYAQLSEMKAKDLLTLQLKYLRLAAKVVHDYNKSAKQHKCVLVFGKKGLLSILKDGTISLTDYLNLGHLTAHKIKNIG